MLNCFRCPVNILGLFDEASIFWYDLEQSILNETTRKAESHNVLILYNAKSKLQPTCSWVNPNFWTKSSLTSLAAGRLICMVCWVISLNYVEYTQGGLHMVCWEYHWIMLDICHARYVCIRPYVRIGTCKLSLRIYTLDSLKYFFES